MLTDRPIYRRLRVISTYEVIEWVPLSVIEQEVAEAKRLRKQDKKRAAAYRRACRREEKKVEAAGRKLAKLKLELFKRRTR